MRAIVIGDAGGLVGALEAEAIDVTALDGAATGERLEAAGVAGADLLVLADVGEATAVPVAKALNPDLRVVVYSTDTMPDFVRGQVDLALDPALLSPGLVAEELAGEAV